MQKWLRTFAIAYLLCWIIVAVFASFIASPLPLYVVKDGQTFYPMFQPLRVLTCYNPRTRTQSPQILSKIDWRNQKTTRIVWTLIPYNHIGNAELSAQSPLGEQFSLDTLQQKAPLYGKFRHWAGTDNNNRDVLAFLVIGSRNALIIALGILICISLLGFTLGGIAGFWGDKGIGWTRGEKWGVILLLFPAFFYGIYLPRFALTDAWRNSTFEGIFLTIVCLAVVCALLLLGKFMGKLLAKNMAFLGVLSALPTDKWVTRLLDIQYTLPLFLIFMSFSVIFPKGAGTIIAVVSITGYVGFARITRAWVKQAAQTQYVEAARALGYTDFRILYKHIFPNLAAKFGVLLLLSMADILSIDAALSFLGIGLAPEAASWGAMLAEARNHPDAWWLLFFPLFLLFCTVASLHILAQSLKEK